MIDREFKNQESGEVVKVLNDDGIWFTLNNGAKIKKESFSSRYTDVVDPSSFFSSQPISNIAQQISNIDPSKVVSDSSQGTQVKRINQPVYSQQVRNTDEIKPIDKSQVPQELLERAVPQVDLSRYRQIEDENAAADALLGNQGVPASHQGPGPMIPPPVDNPNYPEFDPNVKRDRDKSHRIHQTQGEINSRFDYYDQDNTNEIVEVKPSIYLTPQEEESYKFFKGFKKIHSVEINLKLEEKIAEPEFLKMMSNNFEADVIKFYTRQIFQSMIHNTKQIEKDIYNQLSDIVFGEKKKTQKKPRKVGISYDPDRMIIDSETASGTKKYVFLDDDGNEVVTTLGRAKTKRLIPKIK